VSSANDNGPNGIYRSSLNELINDSLPTIRPEIAAELLVGAGLLGKSLYRLLHVEIGMRTDHLALYFTESLRLSVQISVPITHIIQPLGRGRASHGGIHFR